MKNIKGKTSNGFEFDLNPGRLTDMRFVEALANYDSEGDSLTKIKSLTIIKEVMLGKEESARLTEHIHSLHKKEDLIPMVEVEQTLIEIIQIAKDKSEDIKNS